MCEKGAIALARRLGSPAVPPASACVRSCGLSHGRACPRGLVAWGPVGPDARGGCLRDWQLSGAGFLEAAAIRYY
jgi:hypothetical protein